MGKYIDLKCDFAFKYCMQDEVIMKSFLNASLPIWQIQQTLIPRT